MAQHRSATRVHPTAIIDPSAELDSTVEVGPYAIIGPGVRIGAASQVGAHCVIEGPCTIGCRNVFHPFGRIGGAPQDKKYAGEPTGLVIGDDNLFREYVTLNRGTVQDRGETTLGNGNWVMAYVHVAHDCVVGSQVVMANATNLAGHVHIGDWVILGGYTGVHQFCKIGAHAMTGVGSVVLHDIPPFVMASGDSAGAHGINVEGLRRRGFDRDRIAAIRRAYRLVYKSGHTLAQAQQALLEQAGELSAARQDDPAVADITGFAAFLGAATRGIVR